MGRRPGWSVFAIFPEIQLDLRAVKARKLSSVSKLVKLAIWNVLYEAFSLHSVQKRAEGVTARPEVALA